MVDAPHFMGAINDLEAAVRFGGLVDSNHHTAEVRKKQTVLIPVAIILMPCPGASHLGIFQYHFGMVVIDFSSHQLLHPVYKFSASSNHSVDTFSRVVPQ